MKIYTTAKKLISTLICLALLLQGVSLTALAQADTSEAMKKILISVKSKITVPDELSEFSYSTNNGYWQFRWTTPDYTNYQEMYVYADTEGEILNYNFYSDSKEYSNLKQLPAISKQEAFEIAKETVKAFAPNYIDQIDLYAPISSTLSGDNFFFEFARVVDNVQVANETVSVCIDISSGDTTIYNFNFSDTSKFENTDGIIDYNTAIETYINTAPFELTYMYNYKKPNENYHNLFYIKNSDSEYMSAKTGKFININSNSYTDAKESKKELAFTSNSVADTAARGELSQQEMAEIEQLENLLSSKEAEDVLRKMNELYLPDDAVVTNYNLYKITGSNIENEYKCILNFSDADVKAEKDNYFHAYAELDAQTGELLNFYAKYPTDKTSNTSINADAESVSTAFMHKYKPEYLNNSKPEFSINQYNTSTSSCIFTRLENNLPVPSQSINITISDINGKIVNYHQNWSKNSIFANPADAVNREQAVKTLLGTAKLKLYYIVTTNNDNEQEAVLVYAPDYKVPHIINATANEVSANYSGEKYVIYNDNRYTDISSHWAEKIILKLEEAGIAFDSDKFKPDDIITQDELNQLLSNTNKYYYTPVRSAESGASDITATNNPITRQDAVKSIVEITEYAKAASLKGIYICDYADKDEISDEYIGYVAIATGLKIVSGTPDNKFMPLKNLTRAEAAVMIYNLMNNLN